MNSMKRVMKTEKQIKAVCELHINERRDEIIHNATYQSLATAFFILSRDFGFGKKRLVALKNSIENEFLTMSKGVLGMDYNASHICKHLKEKYGIDFGESQYDREDETSNDSKR